MIIQSDYLTQGLFGQVFAWMLEVLPYVQSKGWKPEWQIRTRNYGEPPTFNIFPAIIRTTYEPEPNGEVLGLERLQFLHRFNFRRDFSAASKCWNAHFRFTDDVYNRVQAFWDDSFAGQTVLGLHYRGTDKNRSTWETNPVSRYQFLCVVEDFLQTHPDITAIFAASDDCRFIEALGGFPRVRFHHQVRSADDRPMHIPGERQTADRIALAKDAIVDSLTLSRCRYVLKSMSQLSAFSKVFNPELEAYRVSACKPNWFPEAYIPPCRSQDTAVRTLLNVIQDGDISSPLHVKVAGAPKKLARLVSQVWRIRGTLPEQARRILRGTK